MADLNELMTKIKNGTATKEELDLVKKLAKSNKQPVIIENPLDVISLQPPSDWTDLVLTNNSYNAVKSLNGIPNGTIFYIGKENKTKIGPFILVQMKEKFILSGNDVNFEIDMTSNPLKVIIGSVN